MLNFRLRYVNSLYHISATFLLATFAWIFFRANSVEQAFTVVNGIFTWKTGGLFIGSVSGMFYALVGLSVLFIAETFKEYSPYGISLLNNRYKVVRHLTYASLLIIILLFGVFNASQFIYFQF
jgi:hypothetical protein